MTPTKTYTYNTHGQVLTYTDETGVITKNTYDTAGSTEKLLTSVLDFGTTPHLNLTTTYGYDSVGNINSVTDPNTNVTLITNDALRRQAQITAPSPFNYVTKFAYDGNSNVLSVQRQTGIVATPWQTTSYTYSLSDKLRTTTDPLGNTVVNTYDGRDRLATTTDADNRTTSYAYDAQSRLFTITDPTMTIQQTRMFTNNGLLYQLKDSRNNVTTYSYDGFDRLNKTTYPDTTFEQNSSYDANGSVLTALTRSGNSYTNTYDALNRLATKLPTGEGQVTYTYDLAGRLKIVGKPVVASDPSTGNFTYSYDTAGRLLNESTPDSKQTQYGRNANGNVTKITYPDGYFVTRAYDQLNRLTNLYLNGSATSAAQFAYDQLSRPQSLTYNNGTSVGYSLQLNNDLNQLTQSFVGSSVTYTYGFNHSHQVVSQNVSDNTYLWHPVAAAAVTYTAANTTNQYPTIGGVSYTYDGNGNLKTDGTWTYTYDTENQLLSAVKTGVSASYVYDPLHRQAQKTVGSTKTRFIYGRSDRLADYDGTAGTLQNRYLYGDQSDQPLIQVSGAGTISYLHQDRANSLIAVSSAAGAVTNKNAFSPFGESASVPASGFGFTGQRYDSETGLYYYKSRYYSPVLGRFMQADSIGYVSDPNLYAYVRNDALNHTDPSGKAPDQNKVTNNADPNNPDNHGNGVGPYNPNNNGPGNTANPNNPDNYGNGVGPNNPNNGGPGNTANPNNPNNFGNGVGPYNPGNGVGPNNPGNSIIGPIQTGNGIGPLNPGNAKGPNNPGNPENQVTSPTIINGGNAANSSSGGAFGGASSSSAGLSASSSSGGFAIGGGSSSSTSASTYGSANYGNASSASSSGTSSSGTPYSNLIGPDQR
jgi:RHS repeat-associated protein